MTASIGWPVCDCKAHAKCWPRNIHCNCNNISIPGYRYRYCILAILILMLYLPFRYYIITGSEAFLNGTGMQTAAACCCNARTGTGNGDEVIQLGIYCGFFLVSFL